MMEKIIKILRGGGNNKNRYGASNKEIGALTDQKAQDPLSDVEENEIYYADRAKEALDDEEDNRDVMRSKKNKMSPIDMANKSAFDAGDDEDEEEPKGKLYGDGHKKMMMKIILGLGKPGGKGIINGK